MVSYMPIIAIFLWPTCNEITKTRSMKWVNGTYVALQLTRAWVQRTVFMEFTDISTYAEQLPSSIRIPSSILLVGARVIAGQTWKLTKLSKITILCLFV
jgi:hypothetical protein